MTINTTVNTKNQLPATTQQASSTVATTSQTYADFYSSFQAALSRNPEWNTSIPNGIGSTLLSIIASAATSFNYFGSRKVQESYLETAQSPLGVFTGARTIMGQLQGNNPSVATVNYNFNTTGFTEIIPPNSVFSINGTNFYNPDYIVLNSNTSTGGSFLLVEGTQTTEVFKSSGESFQKYYLSSNFNSGPYTVVNALDPITYENQTWTRVDSLVNEGCQINDDPNGFGNLIYTALNTYEAALYPDGSLCLSFGDGVFGAIPPQQSNISITYFEASGGSANSIFSTNPEKQPVVSIVSGNNLSTSEINFINSNVNMRCSSIVAGSPPPSYLFYKKLAPSVYASALRQVSPQDYEASLEAFRYPGSNLSPVKACKVITERDSILRNPTLANTVVPVLVMDQVLYADPLFKETLSQYLSLTSTPSIISPILFEALPFKLTINIKYVDFTIPESTLQQNIVDALTNYIKIYANEIVSIDSVSSPYWYVDTATQDLLGKTYFLSDFYNILLPVIGNNGCTISYLFNGSNNELDLKTYQCLAFDFSNGNNPINIVISS